MEQDDAVTGAPETHGDLLATAKERFRASMDHSASWREQAEEDYAFVAGDQWDQVDLDAMREQLRPPVTYNRIEPMVGAVAGHEVSNRQEVRYLPREMGDVGVNELYTGAAEWARDESDAEDEESDAFFDTLVCGMGWTNTRMDWDDDPAGEIKIERIDSLEMFWDPTAKKRNLSDGRYVFRVQDKDEGDVRAEWPHFEGVTTGTDQGWGLPLGSMGEPHHTVPGDQYASEEHDGGSNHRRGVRIVEYQWCEREPVVAMQDPMTGQMVDMEPERALILAEAMMARGMVPQMHQRTRKRYYKAFFAGDQVLQVSLNADPERFTYQCITGRRDRNNNTWYGIVRSLKDPQRWANKFFSQMMHIINSNSKGGLLFEEDAFSDPARAEADWARADSFVQTQDGAISGKKIMPKPVAELPNALIALFSFSLDAFPQVTGINHELIGQADRNQPGMLEHQRKQSGLTILATLFDSLRRYRKNQGRVLLCFIRKYISDGRLVRIVGNDGKQQYVPLMKQQGTATYDVIVDEAPSSPNQKERTFAYLTAMFPPQTWPMLPPAMTLEILRYSPLPESLVNRLAELYEQQGQDPAQAAIQQLAMRQAQADVEKTQSETVENQADAFLKRTKAMAEGVTVPAKMVQMTAPARSRLN